MSDTAPKSTKRIFMYKMIQGQKVRWKIEVDSEMVIVSEGPADNQEPRARVVAPGPRPVALDQDAMAKYKRVLEERGIKYSITESGQIVVNEIPHDERLIMQFFDLNAPCPDIEGLEAVRANYKYEYDRAGGDACPGCQLNALQRKYREIVKEKLANVAGKI